MENTNILWADDEIDLLKPHVMFLEEKGYHVSTANSGITALDKVKSEHFDLVLLDENMPGLSGLETLNKIKELQPLLPVVMITKSEEEHIMEEAIGSKISDYLIKPVNPKQILLSIKKNLETKRLVSEKTTSQYQQEFRNIGMNMSDRLNVAEWKELYKKLVYWELELEKSTDVGMAEILKMQKQEANNLFCRFVEKNYVSWVNGKAPDAPLMAHQLIKNKIIPHINERDPLFFVLIDNLRYDQWRVIKHVLSDFFTIEQEDLFFSILPTATQYARNAIFAGLMPSEIQRLFPSLWVGDDQEEGKNLHEEEFLAAQLKRLGKNIKLSYNKITTHDHGKKVAENFANLLNNQLNVIVYNFVDMLSHARTEMEVIRELADDVRAYRSLTLSWFEHSPLLDIFKHIAEKKARVIIATDHGTVHVKEPIKVVGERNTTTNLRYKQGRNLAYNPKEVFEVKNPADVFLPKLNVSTAYIFAKEDKFFAYPNNFNYYVQYYKNTFQHGGISLEEMIIPAITMKGK